jgi:eukaryotic-like serine/threonine-protein kinase
MGRVEVVEDRLLNRPVARKVLDLGGRTPSATMIARFLREARVTARLEHPAIVPIHDLIRLEDGRIAYTMKRVRGRTLAQALKQAPDLESRLALLSHLQDVCNALAFAHSHGVVHRDLKPANVLIGEFGETVVIDWGLAGVPGEDEPAWEVDTAPLSGDSGLTQAGNVMGTPRYMSPEQALGDAEHVDATADVWALGMMLREVLSGHRPYGEASSEEMLAQARWGEPGPAQAIAPKAPKELCAIADMATDRDPQDRYPHAGALAEDLTAWRAGRRVSAFRYGFRDTISRLTNRHSVIIQVVIAALVVLALLQFGALMRIAQAEAEAVAQMELAESHRVKAKVDKLRAESRMELARDRSDRSLTLLWAAAEASDWRDDALRAELARELNQTWPQSLVHRSATQIDAIAHAGPDGDVWLVLNTGVINTGNENGLSALRNSLSSRPDAIASSDAGLLVGHVDGDSLEFQRRKLDGSLDATWTVPDEQDLYLLVPGLDGGAVAGLTRGRALLLRDDGTSQELGDGDTGAAQVESLAVAREAGVVLAAAMGDNRLRAWAWEDGALLQSWNLGEITSDIVVNAHATTILAGSMDGILHRLPTRGEPWVPSEASTSTAWTLDVGGDRMRIALSEGGDRAVVTTSRGEAVAVDVHQGRVLWRFPGLDFQEGLRPAFSADGRRVAVPGRGNGVLVLDTATGTQLARLGGSGRRLAGILFEGDAAVWAASVDGTVERWRAPDIGGGWGWAASGDSLTAFALERSGDTALIGDHDGRVTRLDLKTGQSKTVAELGALVCMLAPTDQGGWQAVTAARCARGAAGNIARRTSDSRGGGGWELHRRTADSSTDGDTGPVAEAPGAWGVVTAAVAGDEVLILEGSCLTRVLATGQTEDAGCLDVDNTWTPRSLAGTGDGGFVASAAKGSPALISVAKDASERWRTSDAKRAVPSPDGTRWALMLGTPSPGVEVVDAATGDTIALRSSDSPVVALAWSPDGASLGWASTDETAEVWFPTADTHQPLRGLDKPAASITVGNGGAWAATIDEDGDVLQWLTGMDAPVASFSLPRAWSTAHPLLLPQLHRLVVVGHSAAVGRTVLADIGAQALPVAASTRTSWRLCDVATSNKTPPDDEPTTDRLSLVPNGAPRAWLPAACR